MSWKESVTNLRLSDHSSVVWNDKLYVYGGENEMSEINGQLYEMDLCDKNASFQVKAAANLPCGRENHTSCVVSDKMWTFGGKNNRGCFNELLEYDFINGHWLVHKDLPISPRCCHSMVYWTAENMLIVYGGWNENDFYGDIWGISLNNKEKPQCVKIQANRPIVRVRHSAVMDKTNQMFVFGGEDENMYLQDQTIAFTFSKAGDEYSCQIQEIAVETPMTPRYGHQACVYYNKMVVFGGYAGDMKLLNEFGLLPMRKPSTKWNFFDSGMLEKRYSHTMNVSSDGKIIIYGGKNINFQTLGDLHLLEEKITKNNYINVTGKLEWCCDVCTMVNVTDPDEAICCMCGNVHYF